MTINFRQFSNIVFYLLVSLKFLALPSLIFEDCGADSWMVFAFMTVIDVALVWITIYLIRVSDEKNFYQFLKNRIGVVATRILCFLFVLLFLIDILDAATGIFRLLVEEFYTQIKWYNYLIPMLAVVSLIVYKGARNIGRVCELFIWIIVAGLIFVVLKSLNMFEPFFFLPVLSNGIKPVLSSLIRHITWFGTPITLLFLIGDVDRTTYRRKQIWKFVLIAIVEIAVLIIAFYGVFKETAGLHSFALTDLSQVTNETTALDELSWFAVCVWVVAQILSLTVVMFAANKALKYTFSIKNDWLSLLLINVAIIIYFNVDELTVSLKNYFFHPVVTSFGWVMKVGVIIVLLIAHFIYIRKRRKANE